MTAIDFGDAWVYSFPDQSDRFLYAPKLPDVACDPNGHPQLNLVAAGDGGFLQITARWGLDEVRVKALGQAVAKRLGCDVDEIQLEPVPDRVDEVTLLLGQGDGDFVALQSAQSSGMPPFHTAFSVLLDEDQMGRARRGLAGERGYLAIRYVLTRSFSADMREHWQAGVSSEAKRVSAGCEASATFQATSSASFKTDAPRSEHLTVEGDAADWSRCGVK